MPIHCRAGRFWGEALEGALPPGLVVILDLPPGSALFRPPVAEADLVVTPLAGAPYLEDLHDRWPGRVLPPPVLPGRVRPAAELIAGGGRLPRPVRRSGLSARERQVLRMLVAGERPSVIAARLGLAPGTVHAYLRDLREKLDVPSPAALVAAYFGLEVWGSSP